MSKKNALKNETAKHSEEYSESASGQIRLPRLLQINLGAKAPTNYRDLFIPVLKAGASYLLYMKL